MTNTSTLVTDCSILCGVLTQDSKESSLIKDLSAHISEIRIWWLQGSGVERSIYMQQYPGILNVEIISGI